MSQYATIKAIIDQVVTTNGQQEITGALLNEVLKAMVDSLGSDYQYGGVVVPSSNVGTPDQNVFYAATKAGTYTNFGNVTLPAGLTFLKWNGSWGHDIIIKLDDEPTAFSKNLISSGAVFKALANYAKTLADFDADFDISDENGYVLMRLINGHIKTKNFDSENPISQVLRQDSFADFDLTDDHGNVLMRLINGHIKTKNFDSETLINVASRKPVLLHVIMLGQSLSVGYAASPCLNAVNTNRAWMFKQVRSQDFGYIFNISKSTYNANQEYYDGQFYGTVKHLQEQGGNGYNSSKWEDASNNEYETPCSGIVEALLKSYQGLGCSDIPFDVLCTASGIGGSPITSFDDDTDKIINRTHRDIINAYRYAFNNGYSYQPVIFWVQGENNSGFTKQTLKDKYLQLYNNLKTYFVNAGFIRSSYVLPFISYQSMYNPSGYYSSGNQNNALAQFELNQLYEWFHLAYPIYNLVLASDLVHLTNLSSRKLGHSLGLALFHHLNAGFNSLLISSAVKNGSTVYLQFNKKITADYSHLSRVGYTSEQNQLIQNNYGFFAFDQQDNAITISSVSIVNDDTVNLVCASEPAIVRYGYQHDNDTYTIGGIIRESKTYLSYNNEVVYLYAPIQYVDTFTNQFNY